jgi:hypothetical protein
MAPGYSPEQATWICRTAMANPGVPVVFEGRDGRQQIVRVDGGWEISGTR